MTKRDGDRLREMQSDLKTMADDYDNAPPIFNKNVRRAFAGRQTEAQQMRELAYGIRLLLEGGRRFAVQVEDLR